jgi:hypothetical protein
MYVNLCNHQRLKHENLQEKKFLQEKENIYLGNITPLC